MTVEAGSTWSMSTIEELDTIPKILVRNYRDFGQRVAMRQKMLGVWREYTWNECHDNVKEFSLGLANLGLDRGGKVAIIGDNSPQWYWAEIAAMAVGAVVIGIHSEASPEDLRQLLTQSEAAFVVAKDREQIEKLLKVKDEFPKLQKVIYWDTEGMEIYNDRDLISFDAVKELGKDCEETHPGVFERSIQEGKGSDLALLCYYASWAVDPLPRGIMFNYDSIIQLAPGWRDCRPVHENDNYFSYVSPAMFLEQKMGIAGGMLTPLVVNFSEEPQLVQEDIREIGPAILAYPSEILDGMISTVRTKVQNAGFLRRLVYHCALPVGYKTSEFRLKGESPNMFWRTLHTCAHLILFRPLRDKLGMAHTKVLSTGGSSLAPDVSRFFHAIGINLVQGYSLAECPVIAVQMELHAGPDTIGSPIPGQHVRVASNGEILVRGLCLFQGYHEDEEGTRKKWRMAGFAVEISASSMRWDGSSY